MAASAGADSGDTGSQSTLRPLHTPSHQVLLHASVLYPATGGDNQVWTLEPVADGYVRIVARHSGKAMDVECASTDDGAGVVQYTPHGNANQQWLLRAVP